MSERLEIHPTHPQARLIRRAVDRLNNGDLIAYPTDSGYAFGWALGHREAQERVMRIRKLDGRHNYTLVCSELSQIGKFARLENSAFRLVRRLTPGPFTFILPATNELPKRLRTEKRRSVGVRIPDHVVARALVDALGEPLTSSTLSLPDLDQEGMDVDELLDRIEPLVDCVIDAGFCGKEPTTVVDLIDDTPSILRQGAGIVDFA